MVVPGYYWQFYRSTGRVPEVVGGADLGSTSYSRTFVVVGKLTFILPLANTLIESPPVRCLQVTVNSTLNKFCSVCGRGGGVWMVPKGPIFSTRRLVITTCQGADHHQLIVHRAATSRATSRSFREPHRLFSRPPFNNAGINAMHTQKHLQGRHPHTRPRTSTRSDLSSQKVTDDLRLAKVHDHQEIAEDVHTKHKNDPVSAADLPG